MTSGGQQGQLTLHVIGAFQVRCDGRLRSLPRSAERVVAMAALLGPTDRSLASERLWPDAHGSRARANLRAAISRVGSSVPGLLEISGGALALGEDVAVDLQQARAWIDRMIYDASTDTSDPPPPGIGRQVLPGWQEEWVQIPRDRLQLLQAQALETAAERLLTAGRHAEALPYALGAAELQPWSDSANRLLIEVHARRGDQSNALRRFLRFRRAVEQELGVQPSQDTLAVIRQLYPFAALLLDPEGRTQTT